MTNNYTKYCSLCLILVSFLMGTFSFAQQPSPKYEVRAAWLTTAYGLDWPTKRATGPSAIEQQKEELIGILDKLYEANFNTVLFQARMRGDVSYPSSIEPFSYVMGGRTGADPGYDPLAFAIEECHKRGMECHAWIVAIPLGNKKHVSNLKNQSVTRKRPAICVSYKNEWFLNPGHPGTKEYLMDIVTEILTRYDIDGVHFDYLRYPERSEKAFPDAREYRAYGKGVDKSQWRRENLTAIVRHLYNGVKEIKPWVKVSSSPVGKHSDTYKYSSRGWNAYHTVGQDVGAWLAEGIQDQVYPMMYFRGNNFYPFALDWKERSNGRQVIPGLGIYFLDPREGNWELPDVERQLNFTRYIGNNGQAYYRTEFLMNNTKGVYELLKGGYYEYPALIPPLTWINSEAPASPSSLKLERESGTITLTWEAGPGNKELYYVVYGSDEFPVDVSAPENIIAQRLSTTAFRYTFLYPWENKRYFAVTAVDRYGNESEPAALAD